MLSTVVDLMACKRSKHVVMQGRILVAAPSYQAELEYELAHRQLTFLRLAEGLYHCSNTDTVLVWPVCEWFDLEELSFESIGHAAKLLRERGPYWDHFPIEHARRSQLIQDKLLKVKNKAFTFPSEKAFKARGVFCLTDNKTMIVAKSCSRPFINGKFPFEQDRHNPPARAYLKIWEALSLLQTWPHAGDKVIELGAAPGAWTWAFAQLGADIHSYDRAPLDPRIEQLPQVHHIQGDAFALDYTSERCDWLCSDLICYPDRLIELIHDCLNNKACDKLIITIKFQGKTDFAAVDQLLQIPNSWLTHLFNNKNEICFIHHPDIKGPQMGPWNSKSPNGN